MVTTIINTKNHNINRFIKIKGDVITNNVYIKCGMKNANLCLTFNNMEKMFTDEDRAPIDLKKDAKSKLYQKKTRFESQQNTCGEGNPLTNISTGFL